MIKTMTIELINLNDRIPLPISKAAATRLRQEAANAGLNFQAYCCGIGKQAFIEAVQEGIALYLTRD
jgi:predicted DNA binding CopG/RHH family protein